MVQGGVVVVVVVVVVAVPCTATSLWSPTPAGCDIGAGRTALLVDFASLLARGSEGIPPLVGEVGGLLARSAAAVWPVGVVGGEVGM